MLNGMQARQTEEFGRWLDTLRDRRARNLILRRVERIENDGHLEIVSSVGGFVSEIKIDFGPGYRLYFTRRDGAIIWLLLGGDKSSQARDILKAQRLTALLD